MKKSEKAAKKAVKMDPRFSDGWKTLGQILSQTGKDKESLAAFKKVVEINADDSGGWSKVGIAYARLGMNVAAIAAFQRAVDIDPYNESAMHNLQVMRRQGSI